MRIRTRTLTVHKTRKTGTTDAIVMVANDNKMDQLASLIIGKIDQGGKADKDVKVKVSFFLGEFLFENVFWIGRDGDRDGKPRFDRRGKREFDR